MLNLIRNWFKGVGVKVISNERACINFTWRHVRANWDTAETKYFTPWSKEHNYQKTFTVGQLEFRFLRAIRGDVLEIFPVNSKSEDEFLVAFADQSNAYGGMLGTNDVKINTTIEELERLAAP